MGSTYTPTYYGSLQDSIASICKNILPFSFNKRRLPAMAAAEQRLSKQQADNLKWQQESFHQILKLKGLYNEGVVPETEVSAFRSHLLETLIASPLDYEHSSVLRDKLVFLQELLYAKCISEEEYHSSKRPLLQRSAVQGAGIDARDVIVGAKKETFDEEWSVVDLKDEKCTPSKESSNSKNKSKQVLAMTQIKGAASVLGFGSSSKISKVKEEKYLTDPCGENIRARDRRNEVAFSTENPFWNSHLREKESETKSILMSESLPNESAKVETPSGGNKTKRKPFISLFQREQNDGHGSNHCDHGCRAEDKVKLGKRPWGIEGFKKWKKNDSDDETAPLNLNEKSNGGIFTGGSLVQSPIGEGPDTKQIKRKLHPDGAPSDFFVDKVLGENIKKKLSQIQSELAAKNPNAHFSDDQIEAISTRLPVDKADLKLFFPKSWCDKYGDVVLDVVRKEFKDHVGQMRVVRREKEKHNSKRWATFDDDDENCHPNLFAPEQNLLPVKDNPTNRNIEKGFKYNPFFDV